MLLVFLLFACLLSVIKKGRKLIGKLVLSNYYFATAFYVLVLIFVFNYGSFISKKKKKLLLLL